MHVAMVLGTDYLHPSLDGRVARESAALHADGHQVTVICWARSVSGEPVDAPATEVAEDVNVHRVFSPVSTADAPLLKRIAQHLLAKQRLARVVRKMAPEVVHFHDLDTAVIALLRPLKQPWVYDAHEEYPGMVGHLPQPLPRIASLLERMVVRRAHGIITVSPLILQRLASYGTRRRLLVLNSRDPEHFTTDSDPGVLREAWGAGDDELVVLYIGSLGPGRSILEMIDAADDMERVKFIAGGHGIWARKVREAAARSESTIFTGPVPASSLPDYYGAADVVLGSLDPQLPNHQLAMPNKLFESISAGKPLVSARDTLVGDVVAREGIGEVVGYGNRADLIRALEKLRAPAVREKQGERGLRLARGEYGWRWQARKLQALYRSLGNT